MPDSFSIRFVCETIFSTNVCPEATFCSDSEEIVSSASEIVATMLHVYQEKYCDSETGIIASHSSYYYVWKNDEEIEYVVLRPYLGE